MPKARSHFLILGSLVGLGGLVVLGAVVFFLGNAWFGLPVNAQAPVQPIAFPHTVHAGTEASGGVGIDCTFCHRNVDKGPTATVPSVQQCMFCHSKITGAGSASPTAETEITKLRDASAAGEPVNWIRVHRLPDHVQFVHDVHITYLMANPGKIVNVTPVINPDGTADAGQTCSTCHGDVAKMAAVQQVRALKMGDCVDCHRQNNAYTDCAACHY
ncbi:MAG: cytochrome c3 family protein [Chloroflexi bacterium]|nr:cytochrome c3 family protein [Chloroflexota bacterium]